MKKGISALLKQSLLAATSFFIASSTFSSAQAASLSFSVDQRLGSDSTPAKVNVTLSDFATNQIKFDLTVDQSVNIADLVGVFFDIADNSIIEDLSIANPVSGGPAPSSLLLSELILDNSGSTNDGNEDLDNNVNLNGGGAGNSRIFDVGIQIGAGGDTDKGQPDDFQNVSFILKGDGLTLNQFSAQNFGIRLQSVGADREGSSKLVGTIPPVVTPPNPPTSVPEPGATAALGLFAVGAVATLKKKKVLQG